MSDNISILVKLFETLKNSTDKNEEATQQLIVQQLDLVSHIKHLPVKDLQDALKEHALESKKNIDNIKGKLEVNDEDIMRELKKISNKISKMIFVVAITFTIVTGSYVVIRSIADDDKKIEKAQNEWNSKMEKAQNEWNSKIEKTRNEMMEKIEKEIKTFGERSQNLEENSNE